MNICLFPPLFFFCALYYTDVLSTASVLVTFLLRTESSLIARPSSRKALLFVNGIFALSFRQTNIFWVAVFPALLEVIDVVKEQAKYILEHPWEPEHPCGPGSGLVVSWSFTPTTHPVLSTVCRLSMRGDILFDLPVTDAIWDDYLRVPLSLVLAATRSWKLVFFAVTPYVLLVFAFGGFVVWNGGVVLGDKSNHIATLHLPQMLYIWPLTAFFSWPLLYPHVLANVLPCRLLPACLGVYQPKFPERKSGVIGILGGTIRHYIYMLRSLLTLGLLAMAYFIVKHNTIIHPFTLADNRHYVFYIFRILLWHPYVRYLAIPVYISCGWAVLQALCKPCAPPFQGMTIHGEALNVKVFGYCWNDQKADCWETNEYTELTTDTTMVSYALAWLATTTMTLITAPLVEPRYFILPWIFWRLAVPSPRRPNAANQANPKTIPGHADRAAQKESQASLEPRFHNRRVEDSIWAKPLEDEAKEFVQAERGKQRSRDPVLSDLPNHGDHRLWLETLWFLIINAATGYMFLYKGFSWPQEPGRVQRFLW